MKSESFRILYRQQCNYHVQVPKGSNFIKPQGHFLCAKKTNITTLFTSFFSSKSVFDVSLREYHNTLGFHQKHLEDGWRSYGFVTTRGWVINDRIFIFGWTIQHKYMYLKAFILLFSLYKKNKHLALNKINGSYLLVWFVKDDLKLSRNNQLKFVFSNKQLVMPWPQAQD